MIDLIITNPAEGPATVFTRNFRVHAGIPIGLYEGGPRSPVAILYGDISDERLREVSEHYSGIIAIPARDDDTIPENPCHYETMTVKAPILAEMQPMEREGFNEFVKTFEGGALVLKGYTGVVMTLIFTADLIKATIRILSGEMETETGTDRFGRHNPPMESIIYAPAVSLHFNLLKNAVHFIFRKVGIPLLSVPRWPSSAPLALFLSHDVDVVRKWTYKRSIYELMKSAKSLLRFRAKPLRETMSAIMEASRGRDPYWMFDELLFMESGNGFKSTWFFAPFGNGYTTRENDIDPIYHRKSSEITAMIRRIMDNGCELALHGTRNAFLETAALKRQMLSFEDRLGKKLRGVRHHYLMFKHGVTLEAVAAAGLRYDATLGFSDRPGYRNGMASPFFPYPREHEAGSIVEIPLNFMDTCFLLSGKDRETMIRQVTESYLYAKAAGGLFSILVHPGNMDAAEIPGLSTFYHSFLARFRLDGACSMTGEEIARWWTAREQVLTSLEYGPDIWRLKGVAIPEDMDLLITAPDIKNMRFSIGGTIGASMATTDSLTIRPGMVDPETGITIMRRR